jgi:hypothetical protein
MLLLPLCGMCISKAGGVPLPVRWRGQGFHMPEEDLTEDDECTDESCLASTDWKEEQR